MVENARYNGKASFEEWKKDWELEERYNFKTIESKWQKIWEDEKAYKVDIDPEKEKFYALVEFPYPSGAGLHVGHPRSYTALDVIARKKRMEGLNVLYPMGFDAFGLPAENYAVKTGIHPAISTKANIANFTRQLKSIGFSFDWDRCFNTCDPEYYKWTQWMFLKFYEKGLAYKSKIAINWCPSCKVGLANEEVVNGCCERCGAEVVRKDKEQWMIAITKYADRLIDDLKDVDFIDRVKSQQINWIGRSHGAELDFEITDNNGESLGRKLKVFTTRPDTAFGVTYMVMAPEHQYIKELAEKFENWNEIVAYVAEAAKKSDLQRTANDSKTGVELKGIKAKNPFNDALIPIFISDYVLTGYGTGAIMAVPAHDTRDWEFAKKFDLPIIEVVAGSKVGVENEAFTDCATGKLVNSAFLTGMSVEEAKKAITEWLTKEGKGHQKVNFKLRDWVFSRQRYWGEPIPIVKCDDCGYVPIPESELPLRLPMVDSYEPTDTGESPLAKMTDWVNTTCPCCGKPAKRETDTMPQWAGSSWYFLRYIDPKNYYEFANQELLKHWMPVDLYVGGPEHAVGHLLYSRMWNRYLYEKNIVPTEEPFQKLVHQGMILGENGIKMGKRYPKYSINPNDIIEKYGADTLRVYEMFMGPIEADKPWNNNGVESAQKFLDRIWRLYNSDKIVEQENPNLDFIFNKTVKKVTDDYESLNFNTAISQMMIFINEVYKEKCFPRKYAEDFIKLLNPVAPFISEEIWQLLGYKETIAYASWPTYDESKLIEKEKTIAVQVYGKVRATISINVDDSEDIVKEKALEQDNVKRFTESKEIAKIIVIKDKIVNIVVK